MNDVSDPMNKIHAEAAGLCHWHGPDSPTSYCTCELLINALIDSYNSGVKRSAIRAQVEAEGVFPDDASAVHFGSQILLLKLRPYKK